MSAKLLKSDLNMRTGWAGHACLPCHLIKHRLPARLIPLRSLHRARQSLSYTASRCAKRTTTAAQGTAGEGSGSSSSDDALRGFLDKNFARRLRLSDSLLQQLASLPGTDSPQALKSRAEALADWRGRLGRGILPRPKQWEWPQEPFQSKFAKAMRGLEMPRFCRRYPKLADSVLRQMMELLHDFEAQMQELQAQQQKQEKQQSSPQQSGDPFQQSEQSQAGDQGADGSEEEQQQDAESGQGEGPTKSPEDLTQEELEEAIKQGAAKHSNDQQSLQMQLDSSEGGAEEMPEIDPEAMEKAAEKAADDLIEEFQDKWQPVMANMAEAESAFEDISSLMDGPEGFDASHAVWRNSGWREVAALRRRLQELRELRELVRSLGRSGGKGPMRRAPEQVWSPKGRDGVIRSELQPEETRGLTRSDDLARMLPFEAHLLASGSLAQAAAESQNKGAGGEEEGEGPRGGVAVAQQAAGRAAARRLFMVRRAERMLCSYQREGWLEDQPSRATGRFEIRPASEQGPIIVCLDTSGSMLGARETVAKAVALECMRGAHRQGRACYLYAFSGPGDVKGMELGTQPEALARLLDFLAHSFGGGTDVDAPLDLSLKRIAQAAWAQADILMVSDGEIPNASKGIKDRLAAARAELDLEVHGLLVGSEQAKAAMNELVTHLHIFKSWDAVKGRGASY